MFMVLLAWTFFLVLGQAEIYCEAFSLHRIAEVLAPLGRLMCAHPRALAHSLAHPSRDARQAGVQADMDLDDVCESKAKHRRLDMVSWGAAFDAFALATECVGIWEYQLAKAHFRVLSQIACKRQPPLCRACHTVACLCSRPFRG